MTLCSWFEFALRVFRLPKDEHEQLWSLQARESLSLAQMQLHNSSCTLKSSLCSGVCPPSRTNPILLYKSLPARWLRCTQICCELSQIFCRQCTSIAGGQKTERETYRNQQQRDGCKPKEKKTDGIELNLHKGRSARLVRLQLSPPPQPLHHT